MFHDPACLGRFDVRFHTRLALSRGSLQVSITDNISLYLDSRFCHRTQATLRKHGNHAPIVFRIFFRLLVTCSRFCPGVDVDARQRHKQLPRRHGARAQDQDDPGLSLLTGACLVLVSDTWLELWCR